MGVRSRKQDGTNKFGRGRGRMETSFRETAGAESVTVGKQN